MYHWRSEHRVTTDCLTLYKYQRNCRKQCRQNSYHMTQLHMSSLAKLDLGEDDRRAQAKEQATERRVCFVPVNVRVNVNVLL
ncbi:hypothetical protein J6590_071139 [Homalodisca vitripennis]|nr:hypothetical protein J6590_071139 [Homalodisca vitripennis]